MKGITADGDDGEDGFHEAGGGGQWGDDDDDLFDDEDEGGGGKKNKKKGGAGAGGEEGEKKKGWGEDDLDLSDDEDTDAVGGSPRGGKSSGGLGDGFGGGFFTPPSGGTSPTVTWCADSSHAADHLAAGSAESALQLLHRQVRVRGLLDHWATPALSLTNQHTTPLNLPTNLPTPLCPTSSHTLISPSIRYISTFIHIRSNPTHHHHRYCPHPPCRQIAMVNAAPLRANALSLYLGATAYLPGLSLVPPNRRYTNTTLILTIYPIDFYPI